MVFCGMLHSLNKIEESNSDLNTESGNGYIRWDSEQAQTRSTSIGFYFASSSWHRAPETEEMGAIKAKYWRHLNGNISNNAIFTLVNSNNENTTAKLEFDLIQNMQISWLAEPEWRYNGTINNLNTHKEWDHALMTLAFIFGRNHFGNYNIPPLSSSQKNGIHIKEIPYGNYELRLYFSNGASGSSGINPISIVEYDDNDIDNGIIYNKFCAQGPNNVTTSVYNGIYTKCAGSWPIEGVDPLGGAPGFRATHNNDLSELNSQTNVKIPSLKNGETYIHSNYILIQNLTKPNIFITTPNYTDFSNIIYTTGSRGILNTANYSCLAGVQITTYS